MFAAADLPDDHYILINFLILQAYLLAADESMSPAATEVKEISEKQKEITSFPGEDSLTDCTVSLDGSWQKREHDSLDGIATAINRLE